MGDFIDRPHFRLDGLVIVWAADSASGAPVVSDMVIDSGTGSTAASSGDVDLISSDVHTVHNDSGDAVGRSALCDIGDLRGQREVR